MKYPVTMNFEGDAVGVFQIFMPDEEAARKIVELIADGQLVLAPAYERTWVNGEDGKPKIESMRLLALSLVPSGFSINHEAVNKEHL